MPDEKTRVDSIRFYNSGAGSDGASQSSADACLGAYRASNEVTVASHQASSLPANITIDYISGACAPGSYTLTFDGSDAVTLTTPTGSAGTSVTILNGETKIVEGKESGATVPEKYFRLSRSSATALSGTATVTVTEQYNNVIGFDNVTVSEATSGVDEYRCVAIKNESSAQVDNIAIAVKTIGTQRTSDTTQLGASGAGTLEISSGDFSDWPEAGYCRIEDSGGSLQEIVYYASRTSTVLTVPAAGRGLLGTSASAGAATDTLDSVPGIRLAVEAPTGGDTNGYAQTIANETTAPTAVSWSSEIDVDSGPSIGSLASGEIYFIWIHREVPAGATALPEILQTFDLYLEAV